MIPLVSSAAPVTAQQYNDLLRELRALERDLYAVRRQATAARAGSTALLTLSLSRPTILSGEQFALLLDTLALIPGVTLPPEPEPDDPAAEWYAVFAATARYTGTNTYEGDPLPLPPAAAGWQVEPLTPGTTYTLTLSAALAATTMGELADESGSPLPPAQRGNLARLSAVTSVRCVLTDAPPAALITRGSIHAAPLGQIVWAGEPGDLLPQWVPSLKL